MSSSALLHVSWLSIFRQRRQGAEILPPRGLVSIVRVGHLNKVPINETLHLTSMKFAGVFKAEACFGVLPDELLPV